MACCETGHWEADLVRAGYRVLRATWWQVEHDARNVTLMLQAALATADSTTGTGI